VAENLYRLETSGGYYPFAKPCDKQFRRSPARSEVGRRSLSRRSAAKTDPRDAIWPRQELCCGQCRTGVAGTRRPTFIRFFSPSVLAVDGTDVGRLTSHAIPACLRSMGTRSQNEKQFGQWEERPNGGRCYRLDVAGRSGWVARYLKEVNQTEDTLRFWQEIYDDKGRLVEIHEKFPVDKGHRKV